MTHDPLRWPPAPPRQRVRGWGWFLAAILALVMGWLRLAPLTETTPIEVVLIVPDDNAALANIDLLAKTVGGQSCVRSVTVEPAGGKPCEEILSRVISEPRSHPTAVVLVNPVGGDDPVAAARLASAARRADVSVGAIVERPETSPTISIILPSRWAKIAGDVGISRGNNAVIMIAVSGLKRLTAPIEILLRGPLPDTWNTNAIHRQLAGEVQEVVSLPDGSTTIRLDPDKTAADALLYLRTGKEMVVAGTPWLEAELRASGKVVSVDRFYPATRPPKILLVPSMAMCTSNKAVPALPQDTKGLGPHRGPPWSLLQGLAYPGLVMLWPESLDGNLDKVFGSGRAAELKQTGAIRRTLPTAAELKDFEAVVIDASIPVGLTRERSDTDEPLLAGGLLDDKDLFTKASVENFQLELQRYVENGGTLLLVGASVFAWENANNTLRSLLARLAPHLSDFVAAPLRSRWVFGIDNTESMMSAERAALGSLPPLLAERHVELPYDPDTASQYLRVTGRQAARKGDQIVQPTRQELAQHLLGRLFGGGGADVNDIEAQIIASSRLVDTPAELSHVAVDHLLATLGHFELLPEVNGRPAFRRHEQLDKARVEEQPFWVFTHPFIGGEWRDLFGMHFGFPNEAFHKKPSSASLRATSIEWAPFRDYLSQQVFASDASRSFRTLSWGFFDATDLGQDGAETVWRVVDSGGTAAPLREEKRASLALPVSDRQRYYFFAVPKTASLPHDAKDHGVLLDLSPTKSLSDQAPLKRLLRHGRGRWLSLLEHQAARDLAMLRCEVAPDAVKALRAAGATPEAIDVFRRVVQDELRPAFATPYRPKTGWTVLANSTAGDPIVVNSPLGRGQVVLALVEPPHDTALDQRIRDPARNWVDFSALMQHPTDTHPGQLLDIGFRLYRDGNDFKLSGHNVRKETGKDFWPPLMTSPEIKASGTATLRLYDNWYAERAAAPEITESFETVPGNPWVVPLSRLKSISTSAKNTSTRLLEVEIVCNSQRTSVFAPLPEWLINVPPEEDLGEVPPASRLIDLLLDIFGRKPVWQVARLPCRRTLRITSRKPLAKLTALRIYATDIELSPSNWKIDDSLPGQWFLRMKPSTSWAGNELKVCIEGDDGEEVHFIDGFTSDELDKPQRLSISVEASQRPTPTTGILDALAITTAPAIRPVEEDIAAHHGVINVVFDGSDATLSKLDDFLNRFVRLRSEVSTTRHWYLIAFALAVVGIARRRWSLIGGWTHQ